MPTDPTPDTAAAEAARHAGWDPADGPAPYEHALEPADAIVTDGVQD